MKYTVKDIWVDLYHDLYRFTMSKVKDQEETSDILQETFIKIHLNLNKLKSKEKLAPWVYQITRNTIIDHFRGENHHSSNPNPIGMIDTSEDESGFSSLEQCINQKVKYLTSNDQQALTLTYFRETSQKELAQLLGISYSGAKTRVQTARKNLKQNILACPRVSLDAAGGIILEPEK